MLSPVPVNRFQDRLRKQDLETMSPGTGTRHLAAGVLIEAYDQEYLSTGVALSQDLADIVARSPGLLFAKVQFTNGRGIVLPFKEPEDHIHLVYGNYLMLVGRSCRVEFEAMNIESGQILLSRTYDLQQLNVAKESTAYDIGGLI